MVKFDLNSFYVMRKFGWLGVSITCDVINAGLDLHGHINAYWLKPNTPETSNVVVVEVIPKNVPFRRMPSPPFFGNRSDY